LGVDVKEMVDAPLLLDRYRPKTLLARGGSALVFEGVDENLSRPVAIKIFRAGTDLTQYKEELRLVASLSHHGVVSIVDAGIDLSTPSDPRPFLVMELLPGRTIRETLNLGPLSAQQVGEIGYEVAESLDYVHHRGVIHRDITPSNVILTDYGTASSRPRARVTDFGIAIDAPFTPAEGAIVTGTAGYLSPEQVRNRSLTPACDIYSLGLVMLECFTNTVAFPGDAVESALARINTDPVIPASVPVQWRQLISLMTEQDFLDRPTAAEVATEIRRILRTFH
jgi:serine/threonine protein kinase